MRLGVSYTVFDGVELLESSIKQIREYVDFIQVVYQRTSWFGKNVSQNEISILHSLKTSKLIDSLDIFTDFKALPIVSPANIKISKSYETNKRQFGLATCLKNGCTHFISMDVDEFYDPVQFKEAKSLIISNGFTSTACRFINYVNLPIYHRGYSPHYVPFICKIDGSSKIGNRFFVTCDPTRGIIDPANRTYIFNPNSLTMHHMETVRKDLEKKYESTTRAIFQRNKTKELVNNIKSIKSATDQLNFNKIIFPSLGSQKIYEVENKFNIPYTSW